MCQSVLQPRLDLDQAVSTFDSLFRFFISLADLSIFYLEKKNFSLWFKRFTFLNSMPVTARKFLIYHFTYTMQYWFLINKFLLFQNRVFVYAQAQS